jgi:hypothetical protein
MKKFIIMIFTILFMWQISLAQAKMTGIRGDAEAIAEAEVMVETMRGMEIWVEMR